MVLLRTLTIHQTALPPTFTAHQTVLHTPPTIRQMVVFHTLRKGRTARLMLATSARWGDLNTQIETGTEAV